MLHINRVLGPQKRLVRIENNLFEL